ncbi:inner membrane localized protein [Tanacetum coccineum]
MVHASRPNSGCCGHVANVTAATRQQPVVAVGMHWGAPQAATSCQALRSLGTNQQAHLARVLLVRCNDGGSSSGGAFIGGFVLGGVLVGTLGAIFAPQISKALAGTDKKELLKKLPNFIYDEEKALEGLDGYDTPMSLRNGLLNWVNSINCRLVSDERLGLRVESV